MFLNNGFNPDLSGVNKVGQARAIDWTMADFSTGVIVANAGGWQAYTLENDSLIVTDCAPSNYYSHYIATLPSGEQISVTCSAGASGYNSTIRYFPKGTVLSANASNGTWVIYAYSLNGGVND